ncbi:class IV adenylate cyclase [Streptomyces sp. DSM 44915]|uniref:Class IV adenylate cyclase n=1 Tax=Streptomyces chisholmiae TaxID=3075540 RepID=A0ABU2JQ16_9ACTN|nr:class IV adenylate cyclase [Streptomyces sp. DSM 44915]MDT0266614.1 class IV adenylate cyclase [Streptomyces sp. DSM 44915]
MAREIEYEAKVLDVAPAAVAERVERFGGVFRGERLQRRHVYDTIPAHPDRWVRLRDDGTSVTLCVKEILSPDIGGTLETETTVGDFEQTHALLGLAGLRSRGYQENRRASWLLDGVRLELDHWPLIPPYLEIEGADEERVRATAAVLGFPPDALVTENTVAVYARYGLDLTAIDELRFPGADG